MKTKKIIVSSSGTIETLGGISGPVTVPFDATPEMILSIIREMKVVYEIGPNGKRVMLTRANYNKDNFTEKSKTPAKDKGITNIQEALAIKSAKRQRFNIGVK